MKTISFDTNINCNSCVAEVTPFFDGNDLIKEWTVDTQSPNKKLTVKGEIQESQLKNLVEKAGFKVKDNIETLEVQSCHKPSTTINHTDYQLPTKPTTGFWGDKSIWKRSGVNTFNCLIGCTIGDFGMIIYLQAYYPHTSMFLTMSLAMIAGLFSSIILETILLKIREKLTLKESLSMALGMSLISMIAMEIAMNITDLIVAGGKPDMHSHIYWIAFAVAAVAGFLAPLPYNYYKLKKYNKACH